MARLSRVAEVVQVTSTRYLCSAAASVSPSGIRPYQEIPGPAVLPVIGTYYKYLPGGGFSFADSRGTALKKYRQYGPLVKERMLNWDMVTVYDPEDMRVVFRHEGKYPSRGDILPGRKHYLESQERLLGLLHREGEQWHAIRSPLQKPMLRPQVVNRIASQLAPVGESLVELTNINLDSNNEVADFRHELNLWILESMGVVCFDTRLGILDATLPAGSRAHQFIETVEDIADGLLWTHLLWPVYKRVPSKLYTQLGRHLDRIAGLSEEWIQEALSRDPDSEDQQKQSLLRVLSYDLGLEEELVYSVISDLLGAGVEVTATAAAYLMYNLAVNPDKQEILYREIRENVPMNRSLSLDWQTLGQMPYLRACLQESQRVSPTSPGFPRVLDTDVVLSGHHVPKGTVLFLSGEVSTTLEEHFPEPHKFLPERWLRSSGDSERRSIEPFTSLPFGHGPRSCIGRRIAETELQTVISAMLLAYGISYHHEPIGTISALSNKMDRPLRLKFTPRKEMNTGH